MSNDRFYTLTSVTNTSDELLFTRLGANDPEFNLRRDAAFMIRRNGSSDTIFASVIEPHGSYSPVSEFAANTNSSISALQVVLNDDDYTAVSIEDLEGRASLFIMSNVDSSASSKHKVEIAGETYRWTGPYEYTYFGAPNFVDLFGFSRRDQLIQYSREMMVHRFTSRRRITTLEGVKNCLVFLNTSRAIDFTN